MAKRTKSPSGFYTGKDAARRLSMPITTFYDQVKKGKIEKITPPGGSEGYFSKKMIEEMAQARELFTLLYSIEPVIFKKASSEDDVRGIVDMCVAIYGVGGTPSYDTRLAIWRKCPDVYYVLKQEDIVVGYVSLIWFNDETLSYLMGWEKTGNKTSSPAGTGVYSVTGPENMIPFTQDRPIESLFISLGVRPGMSNKQQREYGFHLLRGTIEIIASLMPVRKIFATSERQDGISLARKLGMQETKHPGDILLRYELDLERSNNHIVRALQQR